MSAVPAGQTAPSGQTLSAVHTVSAVPPVLWSPEPEAVRSSQIAAFARFVGTRTGAAPADYDALWRYSVDDVGEFWSAVAEFYDVRWYRRPTRALAGGRMPDVEWFPGGRSATPSTRCG